LGRAALKAAAHRCKPRKTPDLSAKRLGSTSGLSNTALKPAEIAVVLYLRSSHRARATIRIANFDTGRDGNVLPRQLDRALLTWGAQQH
jgi:hypothetical protein